MHPSLRMDHNQDSPTAIMASINYPSLTAAEGLSLSSIQEMRIGGQQTSLCLAAATELTKGGFVFLDSKEHLKVPSVEVFCAKLGCDVRDKVKVISIFGNTGEGKSHTLNHTFFRGEEVFPTSDKQTSCTSGAWAAYDPDLRVIIVDTEGTMGDVVSEAQRTRLLLKVLAISDIVIYRTRAERIPASVLLFLASASRAYTRYFQRALMAVSERGGIAGPVSSLGPAVVVFHETQHTIPLMSDGSQTPEDWIRARMSSERLEMDGFSMLRYVGTQTTGPPTDFSQLRAALVAEITNNNVRSPRSPSAVFRTLKALNEKFGGSIKNTQPLMFCDEYFSCSVRCSACDVRCTGSLGHAQEDEPHFSPDKCRYEHKFGNSIFICQRCHINGREVEVVPQTAASDEPTWIGFAKYAWSGYVLECPHCGIIYRSRQYWYGNKYPIDEAVRTEIQHVWPGDRFSSQSDQNTAQRVIDGVSALTETVAGPTKSVSLWLTDQIAPKYWRPNSEIQACHNCGIEFADNDGKHHCRACGEGVCGGCSQHLLTVPERGWSFPVRVCDECFKKAHEPCSSNSEESNAEQVTTEILPRKYGEVLVSTLSSIGSILQYPKELIKDSARPAYWVPDNEIKECCVCKNELPAEKPKHHCRACGQGVCSGCSQRRHPVAHRGWEQPVRICDECFKNKID